MKRENHWKKVLKKLMSNGYAYIFVLFVALVIALIKAADNPKTEIVAAFLLLFLVKCVG